MVANNHQIYDYRREFHKYYYENILSRLGIYENSRKRELVKYNICNFFVGLTVIGAIAVGIYLNTHNLEVFKKTDPGDLIQIPFLIGSLIFCLRYKIRKDFEKKVKKGIISSFLAFFGDFKWSSTESITKQEIEASKVVGNFTSLSKDDYFEGIHKGLRVIISEVKLVRGSGKNRVQIFEGIFVKIDLNKKFNSHTIIVENNPFKGFFAKAFNPDMEKVELEDVEFEKEFDTYSKDQVEARYLITTSFIERFKNLKSVYKTEDIRASFLDNSITISIPCKKDMFVLGDLTKSITDTGEIQSLFDEFVAVLSLVDLLKLDSKLGL